MPLLEVRDLVTEFRSSGGTVRAVDGVSLTVEPGEILGLVGESGCGKSATCRSILQLFGGSQGRIVSGQVLLNGIGDLAKMTERQMQMVRGKEASFIFQDPLTALNPTMRVGRQISEGAERHLGLGRHAAHQLAVDLLREVHVPSPERRVDAWPHEFSGGLRQRVVIAMALAMQPRLIIADEPTTALDVTVQNQILRLLAERRQKHQTAIILVTHDLGVVSEICDRVAVMYAGRIVETGSVDEVLDNPTHPYTRALLAALPSAAMRGQPLIPIEGAPPSLVAPPPGCRFAPRCAFATDMCRQGLPPELAARGGQATGHLDACILGEGR
ncbi:ABC transporter ATP-binding protein [Pseudorhodobacter sp.]|uniref:ABC transporter ATP-binding protein n=1 Tax=Pseudorhodobacter sp. TaxID=1934400 RepID=UPI00264914BC|nr:ABC transporter ATP-binding protein [Pseudorhodobacter sp.]MDN5786804.1 ABC transporter ATP-binding protein [Pseudorhodobacter sp.]